MSACWINGNLTVPEHATVSVYDHGLLYGDGVFEGIRFYYQQPFYLQQHLQRLFDSARACALSIPYNLEQLTQASKDTVAASNLENGYIRILVTRGVGNLGIDPRKCDKATVIVIVDEIQMGADSEQGLDIIIASTRRLPVDGLDPRIKSLNYLNHILAKTEANHAGAAEAVLLNQQGHVCEGSSDNLFMVKNRTLYTPPVSDGALDGITRGCVLTLAQQLDIRCQVSSLAPYDLYSADECFLTGTAVELLPVRSIDKRAMTHCPGPIFQQIQQAFSDHINQQCRGEQHRQQA